MVANSAFIFDLLDPMKVSSIQGDPMKANLHFFEAQSGHPSVRLDFGDGRRIHLHSTVEPERESHYLKATEIWGDCVVILGVGLGYQLESLLPALKKAQTVVIIDVYEEFVSMAAKTFKNKVNQLVCLTPTQRERLVEHTQNYESVQVLRHPASHRAHADLYNQIETHLLSARRHPTPSPNQKRRVLLLKGHFFLEEESAAAFTDDPRIELSTLDYRVHDAEKSLPQRFQALVEKEKPEVILTVGFKGCDREGRILELADRYGIPVCVWFLDDPRPNVLAFQNFMGKEVHAFSWESAYLPWLRAKGFKSASLLPLASCNRVFSKPISKETRFALSFVGSSMGDAYLNAIRKKFLWSPDLEPLVQEKAAALLAGHTNAVDLTHQALPFSDEKNKTWLTSLIIHTASHAKRVAVCAQLLPENLSIIGDPKSWQSLLGSGAQCLPAVDYYSELPSIYQQSAISLNITSCQMPTAVNQRVFDVPLAGGFLLSDPQNDAVVLFEEDREIVVYRSIEEAVDKARFYQSQPARRAAISEAARSRILGEHLIEHRLQKMMKHFFN